MGLAALILMASLLFSTLFKRSQEGPGSLRAPVAVALIAGLIAGAMASAAGFAPWAASGTRSSSGIFI